MRVMNEEMCASYPASQREAFVSCYYCCCPAFSEGIVHRYYTSRECIMKHEHEHKHRMMDSGKLGGRVDSVVGGLTMGVQ